VDLFGGLRAVERQLVDSVRFVQSTYPEVKS
jgi:hypothetical protein